MLLRSYEYANFRSLLAAAHMKEPQPRGIVDIDRFATLRLDKYPDMEEVVKGTEFEEVLANSKKGTASSEYDGIEVQSRLDRLYYRKLLEAVKKTPRGERAGVEAEICHEIELKNCASVLRLRTYYDMKKEEIAPFLIEGQGTGRTTLEAAALAAVELPLDNRDAWSKWKAAKLLNPDRPGETWQADPRYFQNAASLHLFRRAYNKFHLKPFAIDTPVNFIKLKQYEEDFLTGLAEGLLLGMSGNEVFKLLEAA
jgi:vacuolar-type H+-ATPase subunit C/Vma6